jgi:hypothetical protein
MPDYFFEWTGHIDERKRPENFPREVYVREQYSQLPSDEVVKELFNQRFKTMVGNPGIVVFLDTEETIESKLTFDKRVFIPWAMITHFHGRIKLITPQPVPSNPLDELEPSDPEPEPDDAKKLRN